MEDNKIRIGITQGDINGVGYEVILKTFSDPTMLELCTPIIYGSPKVAAYHRKALDVQANFSIINSASEAGYNRLSVVNCTDDEVKVPHKLLDAASDLNVATPDQLNGCVKSSVSPLNIDLSDSAALNLAPEYGPNALLTRVAPLAASARVNLLAVPFRSLNEAISLPLRVTEFASA